MKINLVDFFFALALFVIFLIGKHLIPLSLVGESGFFSLFIFYFLLCFLFFFINKTLLPFLLALLAVPSFLVGEFNVFGVYKIINSLLSVSIIVCIFFLYKKRIDFNRSMLYFSFLLGVYVLLIVFYMFFFRGWGGGERIVMGLNGPITFSRFSLLVCLIVFLYYDGKFKILIALLFFIIGVVMASKGPLLACVISIMYYYVDFKKIRGGRVFGFLFFLLAAFYLIDYFSPRITQFFSDIISFAFSLDASILLSNNNSGSVGARWYEWLHAIEVFRNNPSGIGVGNWSKYGEHLYPHNLILEILVEFGFLGFYLLFIIYYYFLSIKNIKLKAIILFVFLNSLFSGSFVDNSFLFVFLVIGRLGYVRKYN
ncbi:O-antigen ligase family protein [Marinomonas transparens]|uniref:O-antigen ligase family protein n=1 Tax=Marinomonas transparens TaxID=2795388 RepID=A0A934MW59_9GAMM|nr:O-antigen ligase family protein [Marinomonas transparens]MBJ7537804.1 O-antigen ligase family protein [Marinomonas transparens]